MDSKNICEKKLLPLLRRLIKNRCVNDGTADSGNEARSATDLNIFFKKHGLTGQILAKKPDRANYLLRIPGKNPRAPRLMLMGHLDVVPANPDDWDFDPFAAEVRDGYLCGRGCVDMLNMTSAMAAAVAELWTQEGAQEGDLLFLAVADEEASGGYGARFLTEEHWDKVRADYMITELGGFFVDTSRGKGITITLGEKGIAWPIFRVKGTAGHGSMPFMADNALLKISEIATRLGHHQTKKIISPEYRRMVDGLVIKGWERFLLKNRATMDWGLKRLAGNSMGKARFLHTASRMTFSPNYFLAGDKVNKIADRGTLELDVRFLPRQSIKDAEREILKGLGHLARDTIIEITEYFPATISAQSTPLMRATEQIVGDIYSEAGLVPMMIGGVTDGRFWRQKGTVVYGFSLFDGDMTLDEYTSRLHGKNERISIASLEKSLEYFYKLPGVFFQNWRKEQTALK